MVIVQQAGAEKHGLQAAEMSLLKALRLKLPHQAERDGNSLAINFTASPKTEKSKPL